MFKNLKRIAFLQRGIRTYYVPIVFHSGPQLKGHGQLKKMHPTKCYCYSPSQPEVLRL